MHGTFTLRITANSGQLLLRPMSKIPSSTQRVQGEIELTTVYTVIDFGASLQSSTDSLSDCLAKCLNSESGCIH